MQRNNKPLNRNQRRAAQRAMELLALQKRPDINLSTSEQAIEGQPSASEVNTAQRSVHPHASFLGPTQAATAKQDVKDKITVKAVPRLSNQMNEPSEKIRRSEWLTIITLMANLVLVGVSIRSTSAAIEAAAAAKSQAQTSADQLNLSERPWISYTTALDSPLTWDMNGANLTLKFTLRNSGQTPATRVHTFVHFVPFVGDTVPGPVILEKTCQLATSQIDFSEQTIFPSTEAVQRRRFRLAPSQFAKASDSGALSVRIASCIVYESTVEPKSQYTSGGQLYIFERQRTFNIGNTLLIGHDVPMNELSLSVRGEDATITGPDPYTLRLGDFPVLTNLHGKLVLPGNPK